MKPRKYSKEWWAKRETLKFCGRAINLEWFFSCGYMETGMEVPGHMCEECYQENLADGIDAKEYDITVAELKEGVV